MKKFFENLIADYRKQIEASEDAAEVRALGVKIEEAKAQIAKIEDEERKAQGGTFNPVATYGAKDEGEQKNDKDAENRAKAFAESGKMVIDHNESRAVLVSSGTLATPTEVTGINDIIGKRVSSIIDMVKIVNATGMGAYKVAYQKTDSVAGEQTEGGAYTEGEPTFAFVEITPVTQSIISYISKQVKKQTPLNYQQKVTDSALVALRKRAAKFVTDKMLASALNVALPVAAIDATTLRKIALSYGGDESVVGAATLFLNKKDLVKFGDVRGSNEKKAIYTITPDAGNPNTGVIAEGGLSVPYCIDSDIPEGKMAYGQPYVFEFALFSDYEIAVSEDFKFDKGLLAIRGDVEFGGDVTVQGGFVIATVAG